MNTICRGRDLRGDFHYGKYVLKGEKAYIEEGGEQVLVLPKTISRTSGVQDIKGREVYENDVVGVQLKLGPNNFYFVGEVAYVNGKWVADDGFKCMPIQGKTVKLLDKFNN